MTVYVVAQTQPPTVYCPPWCDRTDDHVDELNDWEGRAVHAGYWPMAGKSGPMLSMGRTLTADGARDTTDWSDWDLTIVIGGRDYTIAEAEEFRTYLDEVITAARAEVARA